MSETLATPLPAVDRTLRLKQYYALTKPRVVQLIVFCAVIGMLLAVPGMPDWPLALAATAGIWLVAGAAAAFNCIVEQHIQGTVLPNGIHHGFYRMGIAHITDMGFDGGTQAVLEFLGCGFQYILAAPADHQLRAQGHIAPTVSPYIGTLHPQLTRTERGQNCTRQTPTPQSQHMR